MKHTFDLYIVFACMACTFVIGIFASRLLHRSRKNSEDFFLAGRNMKGWITGLSYSLAAVNADVAPLYVGVGAAMGLSVCWFYLSRFSISWLILATLFAIKWRQLGVATGPEFFTLRFKGTQGKFVRVFSSLNTVFIGMIPWMGAGLLGLHMIVGPVFGIENKFLTIAVVVPIILGYVWISGFAGILVVDIFLGIVIVLANITLLIIVLTKFGGPTGLANTVMATHSEFARNIMNPMPQADSTVLTPMVVCAWLVLTTFGIGGNVGGEGQRIIACRDNREAAKMAVWAEIMLFVILLLMTLPSLGVIVNHPELYRAAPAQREQAYGFLLSDFLPKGILGLACAAIISSVMSSVSSFLSYGSQTLVNDAYGTLKREKISSTKAIWLGRFFMVVIMAISLIVVYCSKSLMGIAVVLAGLAGSAMLLGWAQWWWWRINFKSWLTANIAGPLIYFSLTFILGRIDWWQHKSMQSESIHQQMQIYQAIISLFITTLIWVIVTILTKPEDMDLLKNFYRRAHPQGFWKPVRQAIEDEDGIIIKEPRLLILSGFIVAVLGAVWLIFSVLSLSVLFIGKWKLGIVYAVIAVCFGLVFKYAFRWHTNRLSQAGPIPAQTPAAAQTQSGRS